jgi:uncharacterized protein
MMERRMLEKPEELSGFEGEKVISLETYRKNGVPVRTPVWFVEENGTIFVHTDDRTGKAKRIRRNSKVRIAPSHFRGKPKADYVSGHAEIETSRETVKKYHSQIYKKYGVQGSIVKLFQRFSRSKANDIIIVIHLQSSGSL